MHNILHKSEFLTAYAWKSAGGSFQGPLSLVLFDFRTNGEKSGSSFKNSRHLWVKDARERHKRVDDRDAVGLILPDTDEKGVKRCVEKIAMKWNLNYSVITGPTRTISL